MDDAMLHDIAGRHRAGDFFPTELADFTLGPGQAVSPMLVLTQPGWSIYALDLDLRQAVFTHLPPQIDLADVPFAMLEQFAKADQILLVPFAALDALADATPQPKELIFLFGIARCGSTLVSRILNEVPEVWSLSEPSLYFNLAMHRHILSRDDQRNLIRACTRILFRPPAGAAPGAARSFAIKLQSQPLFQADIYHQAFPQAKFVFLYRDGASWAKSMSHFLQNIGVPMRLNTEARLLSWHYGACVTSTDGLERYYDVSAPDIAHAEHLAPVWALAMEEYLRQLANGVPFLALRYNEFDSDPATTTARLLDHCGLGAEHLAKALRALDRDSQAGTSIGRDKSIITFTAADYAMFKTTLARHPRTLSPDLLLPDIYDPHRAI